MDRAVVSTRLAKSSLALIVGLSGRLHRSGPVRTRVGPEIFKMPALMDMLAPTQKLFRPYPGIGQRVGAGPEVRKAAARADSCVHECSTPTPRLTNARKGVRIDIKAVPTDVFEGPLPRN